MVESWNADFFLTGTMFWWPHRLFFLQSCQQQFITGCIFVVITNCSTSVFAGIIVFAIWNNSSLLFIIVGKTCGHPDMVKSWNPDFFLAGTRFWWPKRLFFLQSCQQQFKTGCNFCCHNKLFHFSLRRDNNFRNFGWVQFTIYSIILSIV